MTSEMGVKVLMGESVTREASGSSLRRSMTSLKDESKDMKLQSRIKELRVFLTVSPSPDADGSEEVLPDWNLWTR